MRHLPTGTDVRRRQPRPEDCCRGGIGPRVQFFDERNAATNAVIRLNADVEILPGAAEALRPPWLSRLGLSPPARGDSIAASHRGENSAPNFRALFPNSSRMQLIRRASATENLNIFNFFLK